MIVGYRITPLLYGEVHGYLEVITQVLSRLVLYMYRFLHCKPVYYYVFAVFTTLFYSKLRPTFEPDYSTLEQTWFFQNSFVQKGTYRD